MMEDAIQVKDLQKSYKNLHVLKGVDFEVKRDSIFALLGSLKNGSIIKWLERLKDIDDSNLLI